MILFQENHEDAQVGKGPDDAHKKRMASVFRADMKKINWNGIVKRSAVAGLLEELENHYTLFCETYKRYATLGNYVVSEPFA